MSVFMTLRIAVKALGRNKLRTSLTMLGMIIGVGAVITIVALGTGAQSSIEDQVTSAGTNMITVSAGNFAGGGVSRGGGSATTLTAADARTIRDEIAGVQYVAAGIDTRAQVVVGGQNWSTRVQGTDVDYPSIRHWPLVSGAFFTATDLNAAAKVAVLGSIVSDTLFGPNANPIGASIRIDRHAFTVIGVLTSKGPGTFGEDQDDAVFVPYTTVQKRFLGVSYLQTITVSAATAEDTVPAAEEIAVLLRYRHGLTPGEEDDFRVRTLEEMAAVRSEATQTLAGLLAGIASVSLVVGGIGIMNIMLVSVTERTREIGLRMAVGAKGQHVLFQFLVEALVLSLLGGVIGIAIGAAVSEGLTRFLDWPTSISTNAVAVAFGIAAGTGVFFGFYPARKAAHLDPIESLRFE